MWCLWRSEGSFGSLAAGVVGVGGCELPDTSARSKLGRAVSILPHLSASLDFLVPNKKEKSFD